MLNRIREAFEGGRYRAAKQLVQGVLASPDIPPQEKGEAALIGAEAATACKEAYLAGTFAEKAIGYGQECGNPEMEGQAVFHLAVAKLTVGDYSTARLLFRQFLSGLVDTWPSLAEKYEMRAYGNLAMTLRDQKRYGDSLQAYHQCLSRLEQKGDSYGAVKCHHQIAWVLLLLGDAAEALSHLNQVAAMGEIPRDLVAHQQSHLALYHLYTGNHAKAMDDASELMDPGRADVSDATRAVACFVAGRSALAQGNYTLANLFADNAMDFAMKEGLTSLINLATGLRQDVRKAKPAPAEGA